MIRQGVHFFGSASGDRTGAPINTVARVLLTVFSVAAQLTHTHSAWEFATTKLGEISNMTVVLVSSFVPYATMSDSFLELLMVNMCNVRRLHKLL